MWGRVTLCFTSEFSMAVPPPPSTPTPQLFIIVHPQNSYGQSISYTVIIIIYIYHALINTLSAYVVTY